MAKRVETLNIDLAQKRTQHTTEVVGQELIKIRGKSRGRLYQRRDRSKAGVTSGLTIKQYMEILLIKNEILACMGGPLTNPALERALIKEFPNMRLTYVKNHRISFGMYRTKYMKQQLYANQPVPFLVSLRYDEEGYIVQSSHGNKLMHYDEVLEVCHQFKIADPRFFTTEQIAEIATGFNNDDPKYKDWSFPTGDDLRKFNKQIQTSKPFGVMRFPEHCQPRKFTL